MSSGYTPVAQATSPSRQRDPAAGVRNAPPNFDRYLIPEIITYQGRNSAFANVYRNPDQAIRESADNARFMRNDPSIMECLEARQRSVALLNWHIEPDDKDSQLAKQLASDMTDVVARIPFFTEYRRNLMEAIWYGRYACQNAFGFTWIKGQRVVISKWLPIHGDKLVFRWDDGSGLFQDGQIGVRTTTIGPLTDAIAGPREVEMSDQGPVYFFKDWERKQLVVHKHIIEDGAFEDAISAGRIHGVGIRDRVYWCWFQKQETMAQLMEVIERTGTGFTIYYYPAGNPHAKQEVREVAENQTKSNIILMPRLPGDSAHDAYGMERIEPSTTAINTLQQLVHEFFENQIKRYILGQTLSSESAATGLGSGVADLHKDTLYQIIGYDASKLEETLTTELLRPLQSFNFPRAVGVELKLKLETESPQTQQRMAAFKSAWDMGAKIKTSDVLDAIGASYPHPGDEVLCNPNLAPKEKSAVAPNTQPQPPETEAEAAERYAKRLLRYWSAGEEAKHPRQGQGAKNPGWFAQKGKGGMGLVSSDDNEEEDEDEDEKDNSTDPFPPDKHGPWDYPPVPGEPTGDDETTAKPPSKEQDDSYPPGGCVTGGSDSDGRSRKDDPEGANKNKTPEEEGSGKTGKKEPPGGDGKDGAKTGGETVCPPPREPKKDGLPPGADKSETPEGSSKKNDQPPTKAPPRIPAPPRPGEVRVPREPPTTSGGVKSTPPETQGGPPRQGSNAGKDDVGKTVELPVKVDLSSIPDDRIDDMVKDKLATRSPQYPHYVTVSDIEGDRIVSRTYRRTLESQESEFSYDGTWSYKLVGTAKSPSRNVVEREGRITLEEALNNHRSTGFANRSAEMAVSKASSQRTEDDTAALVFAFHLIPTAAAQDYAWQGKYGEAALNLAGDLSLGLGKAAKVANLSATAVRNMRLAAVGIEGGLAAHSLYEATQANDKLDAAAHVGDATLRLIGMSAESIALMREARKPRAAALAKVAGPKELPVSPPPVDKSKGSKPQPKEKIPADTSNNAQQSEPKKIEAEPASKPQGTDSKTSKADKPQTKRKPDNSKIEVNGESSLPNSSSVTPKNGSKSKRPQGPKPNINSPEAAQWRYQRYLDKQRGAGKSSRKPLSFEDWKRRFFDPVAAGKRPGRKGGLAQVNARKSLESEGFQNVENVKLGDRFPDMVRKNAKGGTDFVEVGAMTKKGKPVKRERDKFPSELKALGPNDTLTFIDKHDTSRRITYRYGDKLE